MDGVEAGVHLPLIDFGGEGFSHRRLAETVDAARECGFSAVSANDHFLFSAPWLDGLTALAAMAERARGMDVVTTLLLAPLRGPVPVAKALTAAFRGTRLALLPLSGRTAAVATAAALTTLAVYVAG